MCEKSFKNVHFTFFVRVNDSAVDLVEQIHQNESIEDDGVKSQSVRRLKFVIDVWFGNQVEWFFEEHQISKVHQDKQNKDLVESLDKNLSPGVV